MDTLKAASARSPSMSSSTSAVTAAAVAAAVAAAAAARYRCRFLLLRACRRLYSSSSAIFLFFIYRLSRFFFCLMLAFFRLLVAAPRHALLLFEFAGAHWQRAPTAHAMFDCARTRDNKRRVFSSPLFLSFDAAACVFARAAEDLPLFVVFACALLFYEMPKKE